MKKILIKVMVIIITSVVMPCYANSNPLEVSYFLKGVKHTINGKKIPQGYQFNAQSKKILHLATLDWPPYIGESLCGKGWVFQFTVAVLVSRGYQVNIHFFPWARSVKLVELGEMDILFPEYFIEDSAPSDVVAHKKRTELLVLSNNFPGGEVALLKRKDQPFDFHGNLSTLKNQLVGVVRGYQNTPEFDTMMDNKQFSVINAVDELQLIRLLYAKRVKVIVGDPKVFEYILVNSTLSIAEKKAIETAIEVVKPSLKLNDLYYAVSKKYPAWKTLINDINLALNQFEQNGETKRFILNSQCK